MKIWKFSLRYHLEADVKNTANIFLK